MKTVNVMGLILRTRKYSEADHLLSLFTPELGRVSAIAKGARKTKGSMRGKTQPFICGRYLLYQGKNLYTVTEAEIIHSFRNIGEDIEKYAQASYLCELTDAYIEPDFPAPELFALLLSCLHFLNLDNNHALLIPWYQLHLLDYTGYQPQLSSCITCDKDLSAGGSVNFAPDQGGVSCNSCSPKEINMTGGARGSMAQLLQLDLAKLSRLKLSPQLTTEVTLHTEALVSNYLGKPLKSSAFLQCIKKG